MVLFSKMDNFNWKKYLIAAFENTNFMAISTTGEDGSWTNPVYFAYGEKFNLYFISMSTSKHMQNLAKNRDLSVAIFSTAQNPGKDVFGVQLKGQGIIVPDSEVEAAYKVLYKRRFPKTGRSSKDPKEHMGPTAVWKLVRIEPDEIHYFDTRFFDEERQRVPDEIFK